MEGLPTAGLPTLMRNWSEYVWLVNHMIDTGFINTIREIWWDVRPHHNFGTVEVRVCDMPGNLHDTLALAALMQCLVKALSDEIDNGTYQHDSHPMMVQQNKWRAARFGNQAKLVDTNTYRRPASGYGNAARADWCNPAGLRNRTGLRELSRALRDDGRQAECGPAAARSDGGDERSAGSGAATGRGGADYGAAANVILTAARRPKDLALAAQISSPSLGNDSIRGPCDICAILRSTAWRPSEHFRLRNEAPRPRR